MSRDRVNLEQTLSDLRELKSHFWQDLKVPGMMNTLNKNLEVAGRVADFIELGELMRRDALHREESCGCHFREEFQTSDGEAQRNDSDYRYVRLGGTKGGKLHSLVSEALDFESVPLTQRSYK